MIPGKNPTTLTPKQREQLSAAGYQPWQMDLLTKTQDTVIQLGNDRIGLDDKSPTALVEQLYALSIAQAAINAWTPDDASMSTRVRLAVVDQELDSLSGHLMQQLIDKHTGPA